MVRVAPILLCSVFVLMVIQHCTAGTEGKGSWFPSFSFNKSSKDEVEKKDVVEKKNVVEQPANVPETPTETNDDAPYKAYHETEAAQYRPYVPRGIDPNYGWRDGANELLDLQDPNQRQEQTIQYATNGRGEHVRAEYTPHSTDQQWRF